MVAQNGYSRQLSAAAQPTLNSPTQIGGDRPRSKSLKLAGFRSDLADRSSPCRLCKPGDPVKLAEAIVQLVASSEPLLRLPLRTDALRRMADRNLFVGSETERWRSLAASTDY